jgi:hypothetical protein
MSEADKVLGYLQSISPRRATNEEIRVNTGVKPHPKVYQITQRLLKAGQIEGRKVGLEWSFRAAAPIEQEAPAPIAESQPPEPPVEQELPEPAAGPDADKVVRYLQSISPSHATSDEIRVNTGVTPNPKVYEVTQRLMKTGHIQGRKVGLEWNFWIGGRAKPKMPAPAAERALPEPVAEKETPSPAAEQAQPEPATERELPEPAAEPELAEPAVEPELAEPAVEPELRDPMDGLDLIEPIAEQAALGPMAEQERSGQAAELELIELMPEEEAPSQTVEQTQPAPAADLELPAPTNANAAPATREPDLGRFGTADFETIARRVMSEHFDAELGSATVPGIHKVFNLVSSDHRIVGHAKSFAPIRGDRLPTAEFAMIAERVWLLEKTKARYRFLVFGQDEQVPQRWLERYGNLSGDVEFYYLGDDGRLKRLASG